MRRSIAACVFAAALLSFAPTARAVDVNPGDSCAGFAAGSYRPTGGPEKPDGALVVCDGSIWQPILRYSSSGNRVSIGSGELPAAPLDVQGEIRFSSSGLSCSSLTEGAVRYTGDDPPWEYCDGDDWVNFKQPRCQDDDIGECYLGADRSAIDPDFVASNIADGVNILGVSGTYSGQGGGSWTANCDDYASTEGFDTLMLLESVGAFDITTYMVGARLQLFMDQDTFLMFGVDEITSPVITACVSGDGNPTLSHFSQMGLASTGGTELPLTPYGLFMLEVDAPTVSGASHTGTITFGTEFSIPYNVTSQQATYIFATEQEYNGNLGGLAGADAICQSEADASWLAGTGTYKALLSTSTVNARDRVTIVYPVVNVRNEVVADSNLWTGSLDERAGCTPGSSPMAWSCSGGSVWTGTNTSGAKNSPYCNDWTSSSSFVSGTLGSIGSTSSSWVDAGTTACNTSLRLYCIQDHGS